MDEVETSAISGEDLLCLDSIKALEKETSLHRLQPGVNIGLKLLAEIASAFGKAEAPEITDLTRSIEDIKGCLRTDRVIIGVVGSTGAGKSSVINALLDEECLVPTNCMRACTAVITEIRYNESEYQANKYCAEVEFIRYVGLHSRKQLHEPATLYAAVVSTVFPFCFSFLSPAHRPKEIEVEETDNILFLAKTISSRSWRFASTIFDAETSGTTATPKRRPESHSAKFVPFYLIWLWMISWTLATRQTPWLPIRH